MKQPYFMPLINFSDRIKLVRIPQTDAYRVYAQQKNNKLPTLKNSNRAAKRTRTVLMGKAAYAIEVSGFIQESRSYSNCRCAMRGHLCSEVISCAIARKCSQATVRASKDVTSQN